MKKVLILSLLLSSLQAFSSERYYQEHWCNKMKGLVEYRLPDKTRVDCLTKYFAVEVDFDRKWAEAIGQSLHYSVMTGKHAGILLLTSKPINNRYYLRIMNIITEYNLPIMVWLYNIRTQEYWLME